MANTLASFENTTKAQASLQLFSEWTSSIRNVRCSGMLSALTW
jgi:hypothetical protein